MHPEAEFGPDTEYNVHKDLRTLLGEVVTSYPEIENGKVVERSDTTQFYDQDTGEVLFSVYRHGENAELASPYALTQDTTNPDGKTDRILYEFQGGELVDLVTSKPVPEKALEFTILIERFLRGDGIGAASKSLNDERRHPTTEQFDRGPWD